MTHTALSFYQDLFFFLYVSSARLSLLRRLHKGAIKLYRKMSAAVADSRGVGYFWKADFEKRRNNMGQCVSPCTSILLHVCGVPIERLAISPVLKDFSRPHEPRMFPQWVDGRLGEARSLSSQPPWLIGGANGFHPTLCSRSGLSRRLFVSPQR